MRKLSLPFRKQGTLVGVLAFLAICGALGCEENRTGPKPYCEGNGVQTCIIENGEGQQTRACNDGEWTEWTACTVVSCNQGYTPQNNTCMEDEPIIDPCEGVAILYENNFDDAYLGTYNNLADFVEDWNRFDGLSRWDKAEVIQGSEDNPSKIFQVDFPHYDIQDFRWICWKDDRCNSENGGREEFVEKPDFGSNHELLTGVGVASAGAQWTTNLPGMHNELYISYRIKFAENFNPVDGGKLPGFAGGVRATGESVDQNGDGTSDRFSARLMFERGFGENLIEFIYYVYYPSKPGQYGEPFPFSKGINPGAWHTMTLRAVMNDLNEPNGILEAWIDGELAVSETGFDFRVGEEARFDIDYLLFATYFGGDGERLCNTDGMDAQCSQGYISDLYTHKYAVCAVDPQDPCSDIVRYTDGSPYRFYAPRKDEYIYFDDVVVYYYDDTKEITRGNVQSPPERMEFPPPVGNTVNSICH